MNVFTHILEQWYAQNGRDLPWRQTKNPYAIWISEVILQQTRVAQGLDYYHRFMVHFPDFNTLASATEEEVLRQWQGLGYYSRARNLHAAAQEMARLGKFPTDYKGVRALKGIGDYTAAAITSIAFGLPHAVVDGNVYRVLSRYFNIDIPIDSTEGKKVFCSLAQEMLDERNPGYYNQAIMDFGALICTPKAVGCNSCPLQETCSGFKENRVGMLPVKGKKTKITDRFFHYILMRHGDSFLLHQRTEKDVWQNLFEVPLIETTDGLLSTQQLLVHESFLRFNDLIGPTPQFSVLKENIVHQLSHRRIHANFMALENDKGTLPDAPNGFIWIHQKDLQHYAVSRLVQILFDVFFQNNR